MLLRLVLSFGLLLTGNYPLSAEPYLGKATQIIKSLEREALEGLSGVFVSVSELDQAVEANGLKQTDIQTDVELQLRRNGIKVLSGEEWLNAEGTPILTVRIGTAGGGTGSYAYYIELGLQQDVLLKRRMDAQPRLANVWQGWGKLGIIHAARVRELRSIIADEVNGFANDYLAANSK